MKKHILLVEDDLDLTRVLTDRLSGEGYVVESAKDAEQGMEKLNSFPFDLLIVDVILPYKNGFDLCRDLRQAGLAIPLLFLTVRSALIDKVVGLKLGADDYLTKPFEVEELLARIDTLLRRVPLRTSQRVNQIGRLCIDTFRQEVTRDGIPVDLTDREFHLLCYLMDHAGQTVPRGELLRAVWGYDSTTYSRTVDVHVFTLRQKLEEDPGQPEIIRTVSGVGYRFIKA